MHDNIHIFNFVLKTIVKIEEQQCILTVSKYSGCHNLNNCFYV